MHPLSTAISRTEPPRAASSHTRMTPLPDRASQVIALTARVWGLRPHTAN
jgi:hypothetical protein